PAVASRARAARCGDGIREVRKQQGPTPFLSASVQIPIHRQGCKVMVQPTDGKSNSSNNKSDRPWQPGPGTRAAAQKYHESVAAAGVTAAVEAMAAEKDAQAKPSAAMSPPTSTTGKRRSKSTRTVPKATRLIELVKRAGASFSHAPDGTTYASVV